MSRVLVTGGAGFVGSHVVDALRAAGHTPRILDVRASPHHADGEIETVLGDVRDLDAVRNAVAGCDAVMHLAAAADVNEVIKAPVPSEELNARGTVNVLEAARDAGVRRVVYASTIWVYSDVDAAIGVVDEDTALPAPQHIYTATKLAGELYCRSYRDFGVQTTILRFGIPYGPRARPAAVVPAFVAKAQRGEPLTVSGTGEQSRRFVYVEDLAEGCVRALADVAADRTYNLVGTEDVTIREIAEEVRDAVGDAEIVFTEGRAGDFRGAEVSERRAADELGWRAATPFREGVRRYVAWTEGEATSPVASPAPVEPAARERSRVVGEAVRSASVALVATLVGSLAVALAALDQLGDWAGVIGTLALVAVPVVLLGRRDRPVLRRDGALVAMGLATGVLLGAAIVPLAPRAVGAARAHTLIVLTVALAIAAAVATRTGLRTAREQPDTG